MTIVTYWDEVDMAEDLDDLYGFCHEKGMPLTFQENAEWLEDPGARMFLTFGAENEPAKAMASRGGSSELVAIPLMISTS